MPAGRCSEAIGTDIHQLGLERGHRTPLINRNGGKTVTIPRIVSTFVAGGSR